MVVVETTVVVGDGNGSGVEVKVVGDGGKCGGWWWRRP